MKLEMPSSLLTNTTQKNYSTCPLKKRPVNFEYEDESEKIDVVSEVKDEPENLSIKKEYSSSEDEIERKSSTGFAAATVLTPTPTYPSLQPWNFHHIPYTNDYYRTLQYHNHHHQISPLRGDLQSPSSPSEGSLSPPPSYLLGRSNSVSPPLQREIYRPVGLKGHNSHVIKPEPLGRHHRFVPYHMPAYQPYHAIPFSHPAPVSPSYSDVSFYSVRSHSPDSSCSVPEDLSVKSQPSISPSSDRENHCENFSTAAAPSATERKETKSTPPRYQCSDCNKSYSTFSGLTKHQQFHCPAAEGNQAKKSFSCKDCEKTYVSLGALKMHIRTHTLPCKCTICGKAFSRPWLLQGHIRTHTGEKPFSCQHCHRAFADRSNLRAHLQTHSDIKKYSCVTCSKTFSRMSLLTKHNEGGCSGNGAQISVEQQQQQGTSNYNPAPQQHYHHQDVGAY